MDPTGFQNTPWDFSSFAGSFLNELSDVWNLGLQETTDHVSFPLPPLCPHTTLAPWYMDILWIVKRELRWLKQCWKQTHDTATRALYRAHLKAYDVAVKAAKCCYFSAGIASAVSHPAQLFRIIRLLNTPLVAPKVVENLATSCDTFVTCFSDKISLLYHNLDATFGVSRNLGALGTQTDQFLDSFNPLS